MNFSSNIDFSADIVNVEDITDRVDELKDEIDSYENPEGDLETHDNHISSKNELVGLEALLEEMKGYGGDHQWDGDWYPATLIAESYFEEYMDEMVADCCPVPKDLPAFMTITLDYDMLKQDYSEVQVDGNTFYYR